LAVAVAIRSRIWRAGFLVIRKSGSSGQGAGSPASQVDRNRRTCSVCQSIALAMTTVLSQCPALLRPDLLSA